MTTTVTETHVQRLVPFVHVNDVEGSLRFYRYLGFKEDTVLRHEGGKAFWASARARNAEIFFAQASEPVVPEDQAVLFYMYCRDVKQLRAHLLDHDLFDGGVYRGQCGPNNGRCVVFEVSHPDYMLDGELRIADPDGYCILVGQLS